MAEEGLKRVIQKAAQYRWPTRRRTGNEVKVETVIHVKHEEFDRELLRELIAALNSDYPVLVP